MFANIFSFKKQTDYKTLYENLLDDNSKLEGDLLVRTKAYDTLMNEYLDIKQKLNVIDEQNSALGNALFEIKNQETARPNATVKRILDIVNSTLNSIKK